jgi:hypothetical protein
MIDIMVIAKGEKKSVIEIDPKIEPFSALMQ